MARHVSFVTRTDCTQPSSRAISPRSAECWIAPTEPPGLAGVERGDPTVPNRNFEPSVIRSDLVGPLAANRMRKRRMPFGPPPPPPPPPSAGVRGPPKPARGGRGVFSGGRGGENPPPPPILPPPLRHGPSCKGCLSGEGG